MSPLNQFQDRHDEQVYAYLAENVDAALALYEVSQGVGLTVEACAQSLGRLKGLGVVVSGPMDMAERFTLSATAADRVRRRIKQAEAKPEATETEQTVEAAADRSDPVILEAIAAGVPEWAAGKIGYEVGADGRATEASLELIASARRNHP